MAWLIIRTVPRLYEFDSNQAINNKKIKLLTKHGFILNKCLGASLSLLGREPKFVLFFSYYPNKLWQTKNFEQIHYGLLIMSALVRGSDSPWKKKKIENRGPWKKSIGRKFWSSDDSLSYHPSYVSAQMFPARQTF